MLTLIHRLRSDDALMLAYQRGDTDAFECLYHRHKDGLFAFLYRSCPRLAVVEELAQEAWAGVIQGAPRYESRGHFKTWLYQMGHNRLVDFWRRRDNQHTNLESTPEPLATTEHEAASDLQEQVMNAIGKLPVDQRNTVLLREQGFSMREIADITHIGEETVKSRLRYARKQLREQLGETL
jgi:RNA polymerase sigma-70 factor (ECF subfamily)